MSIPTISTDTGRPIPPLINALKPLEGGPPWPATYYSLQSRGKVPRPGQRCSCGLTLNHGEPYERAWLAEPWLRFLPQRFLLSGEWSGGSELEPTKRNASHPTGRLPVDCYSYTGSCLQQSLRECRPTDPPLDKCAKASRGRPALGCHLPPSAIHGQGASVDGVCGYGLMPWQGGPM